MRLLLFSDIHCDKEAARRLVRQAEEVDVVIGAGDFATVRKGLGEIIDLFRSISAPVVLVAGNSETTDELRGAVDGWPAAHVLHGTGITIGKLEFFGLGGAVPVTPFGAWSYDLSEEEAATLLATCPDGCILVSHSPPWQAVDADSSGKHLGSRELRHVIEQRQPRLVVCGHIHASWGQSETIGESVVVNAGPTGVVWEID